MRLYRPPAGSHKGENGRLFILGGSRRYHGAPALSILAARRFVDLVYFYPAERGPHLMQAVKSIPEVIVVDGYDLVGKADCVLFGVGMGEAHIIFRVPDARRWKLVIDGDGLKRVKAHVPAGSILTPHEGEFRALFDMEGTAANVKRMAAKHRCVILKKGPVDIISDGKKVARNAVHNPGMTKGGTGDVLSGLVAALACKNDSFTAAVAAAKINGMAGNILMKRYGYNFCASDLADTLALAARRI
ncbi:MAG: NAD(P)H-hydrate dehydratase [Candidatus Micrarchaeota archaeon]